VLLRFANELSGCISFMDDHIYHFAARYMPFSLSHIAILKDGNLIFFRAISCENSKDTLEDVINYVGKNMQYDDELAIEGRLRDYRKYGEYYTVDDKVIRCAEIEKRRR